ncbi:MAG: hypothetical protein GF401_01370 [Chitinivibrionales bacterium]|nr:hypothetical protein [Chitinivibrionales bacterium]
MKILNSIMLVTVCLLIFCQKGKDPLDFAKAEYLGRWRASENRGLKRISDGDAVMFFLRPDSFYVRNVSSMHGASSDNNGYTSAARDSGVWMLKDKRITFRGAEEKNSYAVSLTAEGDTMLLKNSDGNTLFLARE